MPLPEASATLAGFAFHLPFIGDVAPFRDLGIKGLAAVVIIGLTIVNYLGVRFGGVVQTNFTFEEQLVLGRVAAALKRDDIGLYSIDETMTSGWVTPGGAQVVRGDWPTINALIARTFSPANGARGPQP